MKYDKPHLAFEEQVELLIERGLSIDDPARASDVLRRVGYYRFSAYTYALRRHLPPDAPRDSRVQFRAAEFAEGASFTLAERLWAFDRDMRLLMLDGLETIEIALRVAIAYEHGRRGPFAHLDPATFDEDRVRRIDARGRRTDAAWFASWERARENARAEDFLTHYTEKYDGEIPIWVAVEILDLGTAVTLFGLLPQSTQTTIARGFAVDSGRSFERWLKTLNYLRNVSAHHARLWNRTLTYSIGAIPTGLAPDLHELSDVVGRDRKKVFVAASVVAHLVRAIDPETTWPTRFMALMRRFPADELVSPSTDMGFPADWMRRYPWRDVRTAPSTPG